MEPGLLKYLKYLVCVSAQLPVCSLSSKNDVSSCFIFTLM